MEQRILGRTGLRVAPLGFGAAPIGILATERSRVAEVVNGLLDAGANLIDTSACYAGSEDLLGEVIGHRRDECVLVSKCGHQVEGDDAAEWSAELIRASVDRSLRRLRTDRLDVMLLHSCDREVLETGEAMGALHEARDAGKVRFVGYSGDNDVAAYAAGLDDVAVIETSVNIADQRNIDVVLPETRERDIGVLAKRPIANAAWKRPDEQPGMYKDYSAVYRDRLGKMGLDPAELGIEGPENQAWVELALRFTLSQPGVHVAIIGTTNPDNVWANIAAAGKGALPTEAVQQVRNAFRKADQDGAWRGET